MASDPSRPARRAAQEGSRPRPAPRRPPAGNGRRPPSRGRSRTRTSGGRRGGLLWRARRPLFTLGFLGFAGVGAFLWYLAHLPLPDAHPQAQTSYVYSSNHRLLATYQVQNRTDVNLAQVPKVVVDAVVSTEDRHFFHEGAVNPTSIARALASDLLGGGGLQGGSTITQQYVKQAYLTPQRTLTRKVKEAFIAIKLERVETKDQILQGYLNTIYFGRGAYGIEAASQSYFGEDVGQLGLPEASLLAGLIREPDLADPATDPALARRNQDATLAALVRDGHIAAAQASAVESTPYSHYVLSTTGSGSSRVASLPGAQYFLDAVHTQLVAAYGANEVAAGGLRVTTTLDPTMQRKAYAAVYGSGPNHLDPRKGDPSGALVSVDDGGRVRALVGGQSYNDSQVDLALGAAGGGSGRQAGSSFKAFMLARVIKDGYSVESTFQAPGRLIVPHGNQNGTDWDVRNFEQEASATKLSLIEATAQSINTVYAQVVEALGPPSLDTMAEALGIPKAQVEPPYPSQVLGTADVSPIEMAAAYATFANGGVYNAPILFTRVTTSTGKVLPLPTHVQRRVLTPAQAAVEDYVLQQVVLQGTGGAAGGIGAPVAGKTGTTDSSKDAWFVGYTPNLTTAMWMGYLKGEIPMVNFRGLRSVQGGTIPAAIWHDAMTAMLASRPGYGGSFPLVNSLSGATLQPPVNVIFPTTTTTSTSTTSMTSTTSTTSTTTTTTTRASSTTTRSSTTTAGAPTTTTTSGTTAPSGTTTTTTRRSG